MESARSQFEAILLSKRPLKQLNFNPIFEPFETSQWPSVYRLLFHRLNDHLLHLARHNQSVDVFLFARQISFALHEHFIVKFPGASSGTIKQFGSTLKSLQQQALTSNELNQWKRSQEELNRDYLILHCLFNNSPQLALSNELHIFLSDIFRVGLQTCVQNLADRDNKTSLKILFALGLAPLDIIQRIMSHTPYEQLRTFCAQYLNEFGEEFYLTSPEMNTLTQLNRLKQLYTTETVRDVVEMRKQSVAYWTKIFASTPSITTFACKDIVPSFKGTGTNTNLTKRLAYMQVTFDWIHNVLQKEGGDENRWLLITEGRHLIDERPLFSAEGK